MTVRKKFLLIISCTTTLLIAIVTLIAMTILLGNARRQEQAQTEQYLQTALNTLNDQLTNLNKTTCDYAAWDDTYTFIQNHNEAYITSNMNDTSVGQNGFSVVLFINPDGQLVFGKKFDLQEKKEVPLDPDMMRHINSGSPLWAHSESDVTTGILNLSRCAYLVAARPILKSDYHGPVRGTLIIGRLLDEALLGRLSRTLGLPLKIARLGGDAPAGEFQLAAEVMTPAQPVMVKARSPRQIAAYGLINDVYGKPALILGLTASRTLFNQFRESFYYFLTAFIILGAVLVFTVLRLTGRLVVSRLEQLDDFVKGIEGEENLARRLELPGNDEIAGLATAINRMLERVKNNIDHRERAEAALLDSERRLRELIDVAPFGAFVCELQEDGRLVLLSANHSANEILDTSCQRRVGMAFDAAFPDLVAGGMGERMFQVGLTGEPFKYEAPIDIAQVSALLEMHVFQVAPRRVAMFFRNITEQRRLEEQLRQTQKLEAIGELAGGIAHDFNNLLTPILGYTSLLAADCDNPAMVRDAAGIIEKAAERASELTGKLLGFARRGKYLSTPVKIDSVILEAIALLIRTIDKNIRITQQLSAYQAWVMGDPGQLSQALLNLALNARDAMPSGGELTFATDLVSLTGESVPPASGLAPGCYVEIGVADTGCGIPAELRQRIFEPFFTTKAPGKGTGMGLAMVYGIVKNHGGWISLESEAHHGTRFRILLPCLERPAEPDEEIAAAPKPARGQGLVLVVDDEESVLAIVAHILGQLGYEAATFADSGSAIEYYRERHAVVDLVILDMIMPGIDGGECFRRMREINPRLRAILSSGFGCDGRAQQLLSAGMHAFLQKPYRMSHLARVVQDVLK